MDNVSRCRADDFPSGLSSERLQRRNGRLDVVPSLPQAPRQHRISWIRQVANSDPCFLVFDVHCEQRDRAREAPDQCRDLEPVDSCGSPGCLR